MLEANVYATRGKFTIKIEAFYSEIATLDFVKKVYVLPSIFIYFE